MPCPALHYLSYFVRVSVTVGLSSCEGLWRSIFTYANFLLPDSLLHANMQTTHPVHTCRRRWPGLPAPRPQLLLLSCLSRLPRPLHPQGGGRIRGGSKEEKVSEKEKDKNQKRATPLIQNRHLNRTKHLALYSCPFKWKGAGTAGSRPLRKGAGVPNHLFK